MALNSIRPSMDSQRPSRVCTLFATATWVCRSGSPARESRWVNAAATSPRRRPAGPRWCPVRVNRACSSMNRSASRDRGLVGPLDHRGRGRVGDRPQRRHALHRGEGQVVAGDRWVRGRDCLAIVAASSRASAGSRPCSAVKNSRATSVRIRARSAAGTGQSPGSPAAWLKAAIRRATSIRNGDSPAGRP